MRSRGEIPFRKLPNRLSPMRRRAVLPFSGRDLFRYLPAVFAILFSFFTSPLCAATPYRPVQPDPVPDPWRWRLFLELKGLGLRCMEEAGDGAMWFGTDDGVRRYDGLRWSAYTPEDGLYGAPVAALCAAGDGSLYAGTEMGISRFQGAAWKRVFPPEGDPSTGSGQALPWPVTDLMEASDGSIWAGTGWGALRLGGDGATLYTARETADVLRTLAPYVVLSTVPEEGAPLRRWPEGAGVGIVRHASAYHGDVPGVVRALAPGGPGESAGLRVGDRITSVNGQPDVAQDRINGPAGAAIKLTVQREGASHEMEITVVCEEIEGAYRDFPIFSVCEGRDGTLWFGLAEGEIVSYIASGGDAVWRLYTATDGLDIGRMPHILQARDGTVWTASDDRNKGVNRFDGRAWTHVRLSDRGGIDINPSLLETGGGTLWVGGHWGLLHAFRDGAWRVYRSRGVPIPETRIYRILQASDGGIWFAGAGQEAARLDVETPRWRTYAGLRYQCETPDGALWFVSEDRGVVRFAGRGKRPDESRGGAAWMRYDAGDGLMDTPHTLLAAQDGTVWAAGSHRAMAATAQWMPGATPAEVGGTWSLQTHPRLSHSIHQGAAFQASDGSLWFGAKSGYPPEWGCLGGVLRFDGKGWTHYLPPEAPEAPYAIGQTADGALWFGGDRLRRFDGQVWSAVVEPKALTYPSVDAVYTTPKGDLWAGTRAHGLFHYDGALWTRYDMRHGLADDRIANLFQSQDGSVWAVTGEGVCRFDGRVWLAQALPEGLSARVLEVRQSRNGLFWLNLIDGQTVCYEPDVSPPETEITVSLSRVSQPGNTALSWKGADLWDETPVERLQYSYRLDGGDWAAFASIQSRVFPGLYSGEHTFEVRARDRDFNVDPTPASLRFVVVPPIWKQPWFVGLLGVLIGTAVLQTARTVQRGRRLRAANAMLQKARGELEQRVEERTADLSAANEQLREEAAERRLAEEALRRAFEEVRSGRERLQALSRRLVEVQEAERRRLAQELHDEVGQILTGLKLTLEMSARLPEDASRDNLQEAQELVNELISQVRDLSLDLRPAMLDDLGLLSTLLWHFDRYTAQTGIRVAFNHSGLEGRRFASEVETAAYRIVQEALTNVARYAGVKEVAVRLWVAHDALNVQVEDRGRGFDPEAALAAANSSGLSGMQERAVLLGGRLSVESTPGAGTYLTAELPLTPSSDGRNEEERA